MIIINECALERKYFVLLYFLFRVVSVAIDTWNGRKENVCNFLPCVIQMYGYGICIILFVGSFPGDWFECVYQKFVHNLSVSKGNWPKMHSVFLLFVIRSINLPRYDALQVFARVFFVQFMDFAIRCKWPFDYEMPVLVLNQKPHHHHFQAQNFWCISRRIQLKTSVNSC